MSGADKAERKGGKSKGENAKGENATGGNAKGGKASGGKGKASGVEEKSSGGGGGKASGGKFKGGKVMNKSVSRSKRSGLEFPVGRIERYLRKGNYAERIGTGASVYCAAILEYLVAEILELSGDAARDNKRTRITPRHLQLAIRKDGELDQLLSNVTISQGGVVPNIHYVLLPKKTN